jgi:hypothetical protein
MICFASGRFGTGTDEEEGSSNHWGAAMVANGSVHMAGNEK